MCGLSGIGIRGFFNESIEEAGCTLKQVAFDFVVQEITERGVCGVSAIIDYERMMEGKEMVSAVEGVMGDKEWRTDVHRKLKYYPFVRARTLDGRIEMEDTDEDVYCFVLQKVMFNTMDAGRWICRRLGVPSGSFQFGGNKDKRAVTFQEVTVRTSFAKLYRLAWEVNVVPDCFEWERFISNGRSREYISEANEMARREIMGMEETAPVVLEENGLCRNEGTGRVEDEEAGKQERLRSSIKIFDIRKSSAKRMGDLVGNRFTVTVRGIWRRELIWNLERGFLNYFGQQRFGHGLRNHEVGRSILEGDYPGAVDGIMRSSKCYELYAAGRYEEGMSLCDSTEKYILRSKARGMREKDIIFGLQRELRMLYLHSYQSFVFNNAVSERASRGMKVMEGDLVLVDGEVIVVSDPEKFTIFDVVLRMERFNNKILRGGYRKMVERAYDVTVEECEDGVVVGFSLNSSCYATMALREVIGDAVLNREKIKI